MSGERKRRTRRRVLWGLTGAAALAVVAGGWVTVNAVTTASELNGVTALPGQILSAVAAQDLETAARYTDELTARSGRAAASSSDPVWRLAELIPGLGPNLAAARVSAAQIHALSDDVAGPLLDLVQELQTSPPDGAIVDLATLGSARDALQRADDVVTGAEAQLDGVDPSVLVPQLASGVGRLRSALGELAPAVHALHAAGELLPSLMGADGERTILLMVQNNAEVRSGGGITGTFAEIRAADGHLTMGTQLDSSAFPVMEEPVVALPDATLATYGATVGRFVQNASMTPDFALTGSIVSQWWQLETGRMPDAVLSVDPLVLEDLLRATGPVDVGGQEVSADNLKERLLVTPYESADDAEQNALFASVTRAVFARLTGEGVDPLALAPILSAAADEGRLSLWSSSPDEQSVIDTTVLAGPQARQREAGDAAFAVYLNDATGAKMGRYLATSLELSAVCSEGGRADATVSVRLTNTAPADAANLSPYITGGGMWGTAAGDIATIVTVSAPAGAFFGGASQDGARVASTDVGDGEFPTSGVQVTLSPGESVSLAFTFTVEGAGGAEPVLLHTPLLEDPELTVTPCQAPS